VKESLSLSFGTGAIDSRSHLDISEFLENKVVPEMTTPWGRLYLLEGEVMLVAQYDEKLSHAASPCYSVYKVLLVFLTFSFF
jgi:hypothetical protein